MPKHVGIVGCSAEGAALCYRTICSEGARLMGPHAHPQVSMHTHSLADYVACLERGDLDGIGQLMLSSAQALARSGADFIICPDNTIHQALPAIEALSPLPWLHIADAVAQEAQAQAYRRLGLTGTRWLVESEVYPDKLAQHGIAVVRPEVGERIEISRIIMEELVCGVFKPEAVRSFQQVIERMCTLQCDAVILGCTEIPLIMNKENSPLPVLDSTRLLAQAALREALRAA
ncbi:aspartate/glutamate racemase family protein [Massilia sp. Mn16-1_5]|uniref:aspartate/glutamate racemase family protein n=1 Tax=Massilia sp. Mn16-1_5 TaxID=2079199 RepID=UPI00109EA79E|nr:amino acid racemase [Massilia sp. Mn16-1_5]THC44971.1 aspartate racemase [Massilia sp. Mn16-1_5]